MKSAKTLFLSVAFALIAAASFTQTIRNGVLTIANGTTEIKYREYYGNTEIKKVIIPSSVKTIGNSAFNGCENLTEITIPSSVTSIGKWAFEQCSNLTEITIPSSVTSIGERAFNGCSNLKEIVIPSSVTTFGNEVFKGCDNLTTIKVDRYSYAHEFYSKRKELAFTNNRPAQSKEQWLASVTRDVIDDEVLYIKPGTTKINGDAYVYASNFTKVVIPSTVTEIGAQAFFGTKVREVTIPGSVKHIGYCAFYCSQLEKAILEEGVEQIDQYAFNTYKKLYIYVPESVNSLAPKNGITNGEAVWTVVQGSYAEEYVKGKCSYEIDYTKPYSSYSGSKAQKISIAQNVSQDYFKNCPNLTQVDIGPDVSKILPGTFDKNVTLRTKRNTYADTWAKQNGYYLSGVLADLNTYTKDRSQQITEDFTRILCDDDPYANWTSYSFNTHNPLKLEEVDNKLVLTSFMLYPCENVTVTTKTGKTLIRNKTIQPLTRTVLCDFDFLTDSVDNYTLTTTDAFYKKISTIPVNWNISFNGFVRRPSTSNDNLSETAAPVHVREWIALIYNMAYVAGLPEYDERCYKAVANKELVTNEARTDFMTKEQMEKLLKKVRDYSLVLGRCKGGYGLGGGNTLYLSSDWIMSISTSKSMWDAHAFWHEFSHCMGWSHEAGNMCNAELPDPWGKQCWPVIASKLYHDEFEKGNPPYIEGKPFFNSKLFSKNELSPEMPDDDVVKNDTLYIAEGMPRIDSHKKQTDFTKVVIPSSVEVINDSAFYDTRLAEVTIPSSIVKIKDSAFYGCLALKTIDIPDTVKTIGSSAFQNCTSLTSVKIGSGIRQLSSNMFKASALTEVTIPQTVKFIGNSAFQDCRSLSKVVIADGVRKIGDNAFNGTALTEIMIPASVTEIGKNITSKNVIWNVEEGTYAYQYALENKYNIKKENGSLAENTSRILAESKNAASAPNDAWKTGTFTSKDVRRKWDFSDKLNGKDGGEYVITFTYTSGACMLCLTDALFVADGKGIAYFPEMRTAGSNPREIFYNVEVPAGTNKLEFYALVRGGGGNDSNGMISVKAVGTKTTKLVIPATTTEIKSSAYFGCKYEEVELPYGLKKIGTLAFQNSTELKSITIPDTVTTIDSSAFQNCPSLTTAYIGSGLKNLSLKVFKNSALTQITIPGTVQIIGEEAFHDCESLKSVTIQYGVKEIGNYAFTNTAFTSINIPASVTKIGKAAFSKTALTSITIPKSIGNIADETFQECTSLTKVVIENGIKNIGKRVFERSALTEVRIPSSVEVIGDKAFQDCANLASVIIENGVKEIGEKAFYGTCITEIKVPASVKTIGKNVVPKDVMWDVEAGSYAYQFAQENGYKIKAVLQSKADQFIADRSIESVPNDKWEKGAFTKTDVRRKWDFSSSLKGSGTYTITFKYTSGSDTLRLNDTLFTADGKAIAYFAEQQSIGSTSREVVFTITVPAGTKKLEMYALARAGNGDNIGTITVTKK